MVQKDVIVRWFATCFFVSMFMATNAMAYQIPGTSVSMRPPAGYVAADRFPGFTNEASGSSIMVTEIPGPFEAATSGFADKQRMKTQNMMILSRQPLKIDGHPGILLEAEQHVYGTLFRKWIVAVDHSGATTVIVASYPETSAMQGKQLKQALLSARIVKAGDPAEALDYIAAPVPPFKVASVIGQVMLLTPEGVFPVKEETVPLMVFAPSFSKGMAIADKKIFAEDRIRASAGLRNISVSSSKPVTIDGMPGIETIAVGEGEAAATPLTIYQVLLFDGSGYCVIQGLVHSKEKQAYIPVFEKMARSFRMKASHHN